MRLTLRNLLAYLHGALSPEHHAAIEKLVQSTPRVQTLIERCRDVARRPLSAPSVDQAAALHQAETVARYLDFTLPDEQVARFEKSVLASDELLAEVVSAHRVLSDVVTQRANVETPVNRTRLLQLPEQQSSSAAETPREVAAGEQAVVAAATAVGAAAGVTIASHSLGHDEHEMRDSGDLTHYLGDEDDDEELSLDAAEERAKEAEQRAVAAAASTFATGSAGTTTAPRMTIYGARDPFKPAPKVPDALVEQPKAPSKLPLVAGAAGGGVLVLGLLVWAASGLFSGSSQPAPSGPHVYGLQASDGPTCEIKGKITHQPAGAAPAPDVGALVLVWPVNPTGASNKLTAGVIRQDVEAQQQNPYNKHLIVAKADDNGFFHMRVPEYTEYYYMVLSQRSTAANPKTWGEAVEAIQSQVEDPVNLIGRQSYVFDRLNMPGEKLATLDHTFAE